MCFWFRKRKEKIKEAIQILINYVEGRMQINEFRKMFLTNNDLKTLLKKRFDTRYEAYAKYDYNLFNYFTLRYSFKKSDWDTIDNRYVLYLELKRYLDWFKISYNDNFKKYEEDYLFLLKMLPAWLGWVDDLGIFDKIIAEIPADLPKTKRIKLGKEKVKELFKYDKTYPRWVQGAEWPIVDGKPLVFSHQKKAGRDDERVFYYFYDPETKEETVIMQMY